MMMNAREPILMGALMALTFIVAACAPAMTVDVLPAVTAALAATADVVPVVTTAPEKADVSPAVTSAAPSNPTAPVSTPSAAPVTTAPVPTVMPPTSTHVPVIDETDCMALCHVPNPNELLGAGAPPLPADHKAYTACLECHATLATPALPADHAGRLDAACGVCHLAE